MKKGVKNREKDKLFRKKINPDNPESKIKEPVEDEDTSLLLAKELLKGFEKCFIVSDPLLEKPYRYLESKYNPFLKVDFAKTVKNHKPTFSALNSDLKKARIFIDLIRSLDKLAFNCHKLIVLKSSDEKQIKGIKKNIYDERDKIIKLLTGLIPKEAKKSLAHQFIRLCAQNPDFFRKWIDVIVTTIKKCREDAKKRHPGADKTSKNQEALEIFCGREIELLYGLFCKFNLSIGIKPFWTKDKLLKLISPNTIGEDADTYTALRVLSLFANCSYDALEGLYYPKKKINRPMM